MGHSVNAQARINNPATSIRRSRGSAAGCAGSWAGGTGTRYGGRYATFRAMRRMWSPSTTMVSQGAVRCTICEVVPKYQRRRAASLVCPSTMSHSYRCPSAASVRSLVPLKASANGCAILGGGGRLGAVWHAHRTACSRAGARRGRGGNAHRRRRGARWQLLRCRGSHTVRALPRLSGISCDACSRSAARPGRDRSRRDGRRAHLHRLSHGKCIERGGNAYRRVQGYSRARWMAEYRITRQLHSSPRFPA
jgi:hypothetical protein